MHGFCGHLIISAPLFRFSGLGLALKHDDGQHTIRHLPALHGSNVNVYIDPDVFTLSYLLLNG